MTPVQVVCLGEALLDRLGPCGVDPAAAPHRCEDRLGGAPANVAAGLARLGTACAFVGRLGRDAIGSAFRTLLAQRGVDLSCVQLDDHCPSRIVLVRRGLDGERQFGGFAGDLGQGFADQWLDAAASAVALRPLLGQASWLLLGTIPLASPAAAAAAWGAVEAAAAAGLAIAVDVNWRPTFWNPASDPAAAPTEIQRNAIMPLLQRAQLLKCAVEEAQGLWGGSDPVAVSAALPQRPLVVVSDGAATLRWARAGGGAAAAVSGSLLPAAVEVIDSTGAGDAFMAGLLHRLCANPALFEGGDPHALAEAMGFASACGGLVCGAPGAIDPQPTVAQVEAFVAAAG